MPPQESSEILIKQLLARGDQIAIEKGKLTIIPASGKVIPEKWKQENYENILSEILNKTEYLAIKYTSHSVGIYAVGDSKLEGGLTLDLVDIETGARYFTIFNVLRYRDRNTKHGKAGTPLPNGQFRMKESRGKRGFKDFWLSTGLELTKRRESAIYDYMGHLKQFVLTGEFHASQKDKIIASTLKPLSISHDEILKAFPINAPQKRTKYREAPDKAPIKLPDKDAPQNPIKPNFQTSSITCDIHYEQSKQGKTDNTYSKAPEEQSIDEWLNDRFSK